MDAIDELLAKESPEMVEQVNQKAAKILAEITADIDSRNAQTRKIGVPALHRLVDIGEGKHGQAHHVRRLLLGLYNSHDWPFELDRLRVLDPTVQKDALSVIMLDWCGHEVHRYLDEGEALLQDFAEREQ